MADVPGIYAVGELLAVVPRSWKSAQGDDRTSYDVKILAGFDTITVSFASAKSVEESIGKAALATARTVVRVRMVPLIQHDRKGGTFLKYVGAAPLNGSGA